MGRKLDALLGRNFRTSKFKTLTKLAISRIAILKNQRQARYSYARSDVIELLRLGHHERALGRVEYVIREKNMLDALLMIEDYCHLLIERVTLIEKNKECPDELREAISSLIFASSRCGEFPEVQKIREIFTLTYGKDFAARAVELRNGCIVNPKIVQRFSSRQSTFENRLKVLKEISTEMGITLHIEEDVHASVKEKLEVEQKQPTESAYCKNPELRDDAPNYTEMSNLYEDLSESIRARKNYKDVAAAAHDAFESAAYAAAAAKAAIELSRSESQDNDSDDQGGSSNQPRTVSNSDRSLTPNLNSDEYAVIESDEDSNGRIEFDKIYPADNFGSESEGEDMAETDNKIHFKNMEKSESKVGRGATLFASSSDPDKGILRNEVASDDVDKDNGKNQGNIPWRKYDDLDFDRKPTLPSNEHQHNIEYNGFDEQYPSDEDVDNKHQSPPTDSLKSLDNPRKTKLTNTKGFEELLHSQHSSIDWKQLSVRTQRVQKV